MEIITSLGQLHRYDEPCVIALGTFDGLHRGHLDVINTAKEYADKTGANLAVFTFSNHPFACFRPDKVPPALITSKQKHCLLQKLGVDILVDIPFDISVARLTPELFLEKLQGLGYSCLAVGSNFTYGIRGEGNVATLAKSAEKFGFNLIVRQLVQDGDVIISSTVIRQLIDVGDVAEAGKMLGRNYRIYGTVAHGNERGRLLGFPTANLELADSTKAVPLGGVYAVRVNIDGQVDGGMSNIRKNPTFGDVEKLRLETNIFDFSGDLYGKQLSVDFVQRIRGEVKFNGLDELKAALANDEKHCRSVLEK